MTNYSAEDYPLQKETSEILAAAFEVHKNLGSGFLEVVYKDAMEIEFEERNISFEREKKFEVKYKNVRLSHHYFADFIVFDSVVLELKSRADISNDDMAKTINYLRCSGCTVGLILNFGQQKLQIKRVCY